VKAWQNLEFSRQVAEWQLSVPLTELKVLEFISGPVGRCVISNAVVSIGVQVDGLLGFVPHTKEDANITLTNVLGGTFNRVWDGSLLSEDDFGGFTVTPSIPQGTGRLARWSVLTPGLAFTKLNATDTNTTEALAPGWQVTWQLSAGERLFTSVMPMRPYDWANSFDFVWTECASTTSCENIANMSTPVDEDLQWSIVMWKVAAKEYGSSSPGPYLPYPNASDAQRQIDALHAGGKKALPVSIICPSENNSTKHLTTCDNLQYMSAYYHNTRNASEYISRVQQWRDEFGIDGVPHICSEEPCHLNRTYRDCQHPLGFCLWCGRCIQRRPP
jgi:hypothetical protein